MSGMLPVMVQSSHEVRKIVPADQLPEMMVAEWSYRYLCGDGRNEDWNVHIWNQKANQGLWSHDPPLIMRCFARGVI